MTLSYLIGRRNSYSTPWTDELIARLKELWAEGFSASQIADELHPLFREGLTRCGVLGKVHRLHLPARKPRRHPVPRKVLPRKPPSVSAPPKRPPPMPAAPSMRRLGFFELAPRQCRFPIGDPILFFCGADAEQVYCPFHQHMARRPDGRSSER